MENDPFQFAETLSRYVDRYGYTPGQLSRLSGIPKATIVNWMDGRVKKPRCLHQLLKLAAAPALERDRNHHLAANRRLPDDRSLARASQE